MARLMAARSRLGLLLALLVPLTAAVAADSTLPPCYLPNGDVAPLGINPCGSTSSGNATHCCGGSDYCLNNGLCLNAGGSNEITQQACTDKNWDSPCHKYCPDKDINPADGYIYLIYCVTLNSTSAGYCCGTDRSCCSDTTDLIPIHLFSQAVHPAGSVADTTTSPSNSPSPPTSTASSAAGTNPTSAGDGQASGSWGSPNSGLTGRIAGVAVGVAVAVCAAVVAVVFMCLRHRRRQHPGMAAAAMASPPTGRHGSSHGPTRGIGRSSHDAEMQSIEYKEPMATTTAAAASPLNVAEVGTPSRSPPPHDQYPDSVVSPGSETARTAVSMGTLPTYTSGGGGAAAHRHVDPDKAGNPLEMDQSDTAATTATGAAFSASPPAAGPHAAQLHQPRQRHLPLAAELHGQPTAFEMSSEPAESPQELDGGSGSQSARLPPDGTGNDKYRF